MRDAIIAIPCSMVLLAFYGRYLLAGGTSAGLRAFVVIAAAMGLAWLAWVVLEMPRVVARERTIERGRRRAAGLCEQCAYDLTGNASGVCPECGAPAAVVP